MAEFSTMLITGANGFVGRALCECAIRQGYQVKGTVRTACMLPLGVEQVVAGAVNKETDWAAALQDVDVVIHLAARAHVMDEKAADPLAEFRRVNTEGSEHLARCAAASGVKRLVYVSSIKVNGEQTLEVQKFSEADSPAPQDPYAISKWEAEQILHRVASKTGMEIVIVRPPLVYGPGVKGNFLRLLTAVSRGTPFPLASVRNKRSLIYVGNLAEALIACAIHPAAAGNTYLVSDGEDISTPALIRLIASCLVKQARLLPFPVNGLRLLGKISGKSAAVERMVGSLCVSNNLICTELSWKPVYSLRQGLQITAHWYASQHHCAGISCLEKRLTFDQEDRTVSVVTVNYNAGEALLKCAASALPQAVQVIVVDNASSDGSITALRSEFPSVRVIRNERNLGFAVACNQGAKIADGNYILFLNPDCVLEQDAIPNLVQALASSPAIGMVGGFLINPDGSEQAGARRAVPTPWRSFVRAFGLYKLSGRYPRLFSDYALHKELLPANPIEVEAISGACMMARRAAMEDVGLLDEYYFMHCEDLDWCMRLRINGWKILFTPNARILHQKGHCSKSRPIFIEWHKHRGMVRFYRKFFRHQYPGLLMVLVTLGVWARFVTIASYYLLKASLRHG